MSMPDEHHAPLTYPTCAICETPVPDTDDIPICPDCDGTLLARTFRAQIREETEASR